MNNYSAEQQLKNNVQTYNLLVKASKNIHVAINKYLETNTIKIKSDGTFYDKNKQEIQAIINKYSKRCQTFWFTSCKNLELNCKSHYQVAESGCCYISFSLEIKEEFTHKTVTLKQVQSKIEKLCTLVNKKKELESKILAEKTGFSHFGLVQDASKYGWV